MAGSITDEYVFFAGRRIARRDSSGNVNYYFADHLGSSRVVTSAAGTTLDDSDFYPFGGERPVLSSSGNTYKFTGKERDTESGLDNFGARYFASTMGRFMTPDSPSYSNHKNPQSWNLYAYSLNNPVTFRDGDGHEVVCTNNPEQCKDDAAASTGNAEAQNQNPEQPQGENQPNQPSQPQQPDPNKPPPSWDPKQPLPEDPTKLGPDWKRDPGHKAPNDERWVNDKGDKLDWHRAKPGEKGWKGKDHWHWNEHDWHFKPGDTVKSVATAITVGVVVYWIVSEASRLFPLRNLVPVP